MGIYESIQRNQDALGAISGLIGGIRSRSRRKREREGITAGLTESYQTETPEYRAAVQALDALNPMEIPFDPASRPGMAPPAGATRASITEPRISQFETKTRLRAPTADDAGWIGELRDMDAGQVLDFMMGAEDRQLRNEGARAAMRRSGVINIPDGGTIFDIDQRKPLYTDRRDWKPGPTPTRKKIDSYVAEDGSRVVVYQEPDGSTTEEILGKTRPPGSGQKPVDKERERLLRLIDAKTKEAYKVGEEMAKFDTQTLSNTDLVGEDWESGKPWKVPAAEGLYRERKKAYEDRLSALRKELEQANAQIGGKFGAGGGDGGEAGGSGEFTIDEVRQQYPNLKNMTDQQIIDGYRAQGVVVKPK